MQPTVILAGGSILTGRPIGVGGYVQDSVKSLAEERKVVASVLKWLMSGPFTSAG